MKIENGTLIYANTDCTAIQAKVERISPLKNTFTNYGTDSDSVIDQKVKVLKVYGDLKDGNTDPQIFTATKLIGIATGKTVTLEGQLFYEVVINADYGIQKRTRNLGLFGIEKAGTYEKYSTEGWFLDSDISETKEKAVLKYESVQAELPVKAAQAQHWQRQA